MYILYAQMSFKKKILCKHAVIINLKFLCVISCKLFIVKCFNLKTMKKCNCKLVINKHNVHEKNFRINFYQNPNLAKINSCIFNNHGFWQNLLLIFQDYQFADLWRVGMFVGTRYVPRVHFKINYYTIHF